MFMQYLIINTSIHECLLNIIIIIIIIYYYYSHIFPDSRAQHCNYATLLAGRSTQLTTLYVSNHKENK